MSVGLFPTKIQTVYTETETATETATQRHRETGGNGQKITRTEENTQGHRWREPKEPRQRHK